jgi:ribose 5-phosphate isomerase RpiB
MRIGIVTDHGGFALKEEILERLEETSHEVVDLGAHKLNIICMGGRTVGPEVAWDLVQTFLTAEYSQAERHLRRLGKVASLEPSAGKQ